MRYFYSIVVVLFNLIILSCGNINDAEVYSTKSSKRIHDSIWGEPIDLTPKMKKDIVKKWVISKGHWDVVDGKLVTIGNGDGVVAENIILLKKNKVSDFAIEFNASVKDESAMREGGDLSVILSSDKELVRRYDMQIGGIGNRFAAIQMYNLPMAQIPFKLKPKEVYKIRAERIGDRLNLFCNDIKILSCSNQYFLAGRFNGLFSYGKGKQFWNIKLYERKMRDIDIELKSIDLLLAKVIKMPANSRKYVESIRSLYDEILLSHPNEASLNKRIFLRKACLELALQDFDEAEKYLNKIQKEVDQYDVMILKAKIYFLKGKYRLSKKYFIRCLNAFTHLRSGTVGSLKDLLLSKYSKNLIEEYQEFFWSLYIKYSLDKKLNCMDSNLKKVSFLKGKESLISSIDLGGNDISSLEPLKEYKKLEYLSLNGNDKIKNLESLGNLSVDALTIASTNISSLKGVNQDEINRLNIKHKNLINLNILKDCVNLKLLNAYNNNISDLSSLSGLKKLIRLDLGKNDINDISKIYSKNLKFLILNDNSISNVDSLAFAKKLNYLNLNNNKIISLDKLSVITSFKTLLCYNNLIKSFGHFSVRPPRTFFFDIGSIDETTISELLKNWSRPEFAHHKRNLKILLELKKGSNANLKQFAFKKNGHCYLSIPLFLNLKNAHKFCEKYGGHLVSFVDKDELDPKLCSRMPFDSYWIGLEKKSGLYRWSTSEKFHVNKLLPQPIDRNADSKSFIINKTNHWVEHNPNHEFPFIMEWDRY